MKLVLLLFACGLAACNLFGKGSIQEFIPGAYVRQSTSDVSKVYDTLRISVDNEAANTWMIQESTGYQLIKEGRLQPKQYKKDKQVAVFDETTQQLQKLGSGELLVFFPENATLVAGSAQYQKLK